MYIIKYSFIITIDVDFKASTYTINPKSATCLPSVY